jgi:tRNA threonylcarbamoyladenosine biosynthesis protein TsaB
MTYIVLVETATRICSAGIAGENGLISVREDRSMQYSHSSQLTTFIREVVKEAGIPLSRLDAVAVSMGPGSYTGLRIGVSACKGLCYGLDIPLIAVDSLEVLANVAYDTLERKPDFYVPMIDARRMEVYNAVFDSSLRQVRTTAAEIIGEDSFSEFLQRGSVVMFGDGAAKCRETLTHPNAIFPDDICSSVSGLVTPALEKFRKQMFEDVAYFEPFYLKDFVAGNPRVKGLH